MQPSPQPHAPPLLKDAATAVRILAMDAVEAAKSGHPGMPMGMADVASVLFGKFLRINPQDPLWPDRDRFVLSAGHGSMLLYALNYLSGYEGMTLQALRTFRQLGSAAAGHPEVHPTLGIETTTGPLGQGFANAVGMALAEKMLRASYGDALVCHKTYAIVGDGCLMEGIAQEALSLAGHLKLSNLIVLFDDNHISIDGKTSLSMSDDTRARFLAGGWQVEAIDGHDMAHIEAALAKAQMATKPTLIACRTTIGYGAPTKAGTHGVHGSPLGKDECAAVREALGWDHPPFEIPDELLGAWRANLTARVSPHYNAWQERLAQMDFHVREAFSRTVSGDLDPAWQGALRSHKESLLALRPSLATRQASGDVLDVLTPHLPQLLGGSADLTGSNNTLAKGVKAITPDDFSGRYIHYGVREHAMAALMNGLALHGGFVPFGGTFLVFSDYCRPSMRLAALMGVRVIYVMTHDSIGLGEDGPTHQPIEHLASLRAIPHMQVLRPCDAVEVAECWEIALETQGPSVLALTRQALPLLREDKTPQNLTKQGAYVVREASHDHRVTLLATGSEVALAVEVRGLLEAQGIGARVVSIPATNLFDAQPSEVKAQLLAPHTLRIAIEAASPFGWEKYVGEEGLICGISSFGASAPYQTLYAHFGLTPGAIHAKIVDKLEDKKTQK
ncbi:MAG: transketolase [Candidatus Puniceispirillum sp.]|nr:transketolase [Candidatus Puniceispirillum sp.]